MSLARWDRSVRKISLDFDEDFVTDEFNDSLWFDFGLDQNLLIGPDDRILAHSKEDKVSFDRDEIPKEGALYRFVELARDQYLQNRIRLAKGYGQRSLPLGKEFENPIHGFIDQGEKVAMVHAMAVVPDDGTFALPDGNPVVLISAMYIDNELIEELGHQLGFSGIRFERAPAVNTAPGIANTYTILSPTGTPLGNFSWQGNLPGRHIWNTVIPVIVILGTILGAVAYVIAWRISRLTISLAKSEEQNRHLAMYDTLSGLANRLQYTRALEAALERLPSNPFALMQCDLDKFKQVNDTFGHAAGDTVIKVVAERLLATVQDAGLVCRIGGDEFVILLTLVDRVTINELANNIIGEIQQPIEVDSEVFAQVGISLGVSIAPIQGNTAETLMAAADAALYRAKEEGRNRVIFAKD
jgi:diguanylate cyclase (GGDEF)-like protein